MKEEVLLKHHVNGFCQSTVALHHWCVRVGCVHKETGTQMYLCAHAYMYAHTGTLISMENFWLAFRELVPKILLNVTEV